MPDVPEKLTCLSQTITNKCLTFSSISPVKKMNSVRETTQKTQQLRHSRTRWVLYDLDAYLVECIQTNKFDIGLLLPYFIIPVARVIIVSNWRKIIK